MPKEIERKYLLKNDSWKPLVTKTIIMKQGYLSTSPESTVRIRVTNDKAFLTIKGKTEGITRTEFEYEVPIADANELLTMCQSSIVEKVRHIVYVDNNNWEIDVFSGNNTGLVVAEIELASENTSIQLPDWVGEEVSSDSKYYNSNLSQKPYSTWSLLTTAYKPISCDYVDYIEQLATLKQAVSLKYRSENTIHKVAADQLKTWTNEGGEEFLYTKGGLKIRLDNIVSINGKVPEKVC